MIHFIWLLRKGEELFPLPSLKLNEPLNKINNIINQFKIIFTWNHSY